MPCRLTSCVYHGRLPPWQQWTSGRVLVWINADALHHIQLVLGYRRTAFIDHRTFYTVLMLSGFIFQCVFADIMFLSCEENQVIYLSVFESTLCITVSHEEQVKYQNILMQFTTDFYTHISRFHLLQSIHTFLQIKITTSTYHQIVSNHE